MQTWNHIQMKFSSDHMLVLLHWLTFTEIEFMLDAQGEHSHASNYLLIQFPSTCFYVHFQEESLKKNKSQNITKQLVYH